jgi:hypothetical protein
MMFEQANFIELLQVHEHHQFTTNSHKIAEREICEPMTPALDLEKNEKFSCATSRERVGDREREREGAHLSAIESWRCREGLRGRDPGLAAEVWRRRLGGALRSSDRGLAATR